MNIEFPIYKFIFIIQYFQPAFNMASITLRQGFDELNRTILSVTFLSLPLLRFAARQIGY